MQTRSKEKFQAIFSLGVSLIDSNNKKQGTVDQKMDEQAKQPIIDSNAQGQLDKKSKSKAELLQMKMRQLKKKKNQTEHQQQLQTPALSKSKVQNIVNETKNQEQNLPKVTPELVNKSVIELRNSTNEKQQVSPQKKQVSNKLAEYLEALKKKKSLSSMPVSNSIQVVQPIKTNQLSLNTSPSFNSQQEKFRLLALDQLKDKQILRIRQKIREEGMKKLQQQLKQLKGKQNLEKKKSQSAQVHLSMQEQIAQVPNITLSQTNNQSQFQIYNKKYKQQEQQIEEQNQQEREQQQQQDSAQVPTHKITTIYKQEQIQQRQCESHQEGNSPNYNQGYEDEDNNQVNYKYSEEDVLDQSEQEYPVLARVETQNNPKVVINNVQQYQHNVRQCQDNKQWLEHPIVGKQIASKWTRIQYKVSVKQAYKLANTIKRLRRTIGYNQNSSEVVETKNKWRQTLRNIQLLEKLLQS